MSACVIVCQYEHVIMRKCEYRCECVYSCDAFPIKHAHTQVRLNSFRGIRIIAKALGPQRTREELVPYLSEFIDDDDDILLVLAEELGNLIELCGGKEWAHILLVPLETLAGAEESAVREKATEAIEKISNVQSDKVCLPGADV